MTKLISLAILIFIVTPQEQKFPEQFYEIPETLSSQATVIVAGTYTQGRGPCIFMPDGTRRWALESWFNLTKVYRGKVGGRSIAVNGSMLPQSAYVSANLEDGHKYLLLLRPRPEAMKAIARGDYLPAWDALHDEEILAIIKLR